MGLFFYEDQTKYLERGTSHWSVSHSEGQDFLIQGVFNEIDPKETYPERIFFANDREIFYKEGNKTHTLSLCMTVVQEHFCFYKNQKIYEIKLKTKNSMSILSTGDKEKFIQFYCFLAKYCILTTFEKHYRITKNTTNTTTHEKLGEGTYSTVYNGQNLISKEEVALKIFNKVKVIRLKYGMMVVENQIDILEKLRKFHLSPLIGIYETEDCIILVLLKAEAGNMLNYLGKHRQDYNGEFIKKIMGRIFENLNELHTAGFIHRDIKPENIFFKNNTVDSSLFLGDFGLTVPINDDEAHMNKIGKICSGTLGFIAPQIVHATTYDQKCDIFSTGCLFYFLHKGHSIFAGRTVQQIENMTRSNWIIQDKISQLENLTTQSYDLMRSLLNISPKQRPSASQALNYQYFDSIQHFHPNTEQDDHTLREYLIARINRYYTN